MASKVFVSYKYRDFTVKKLDGYSTEASYTRGYVDYLQDKIKLSDHIYKGEEGDNDLSRYTDEYIEEQLKSRIADSSVTIVLVSPDMRIQSMKDRDQWIPWEISYSLKEITREDRTSHTNALLAVVLPDENGSYGYCLSKRNCCVEGCRWHNTDWLFEIMRNNTFNKKDANSKICDPQKERIYYGEHSYMPIVTWEDFGENPNKQIDRVCDLRDHHIEEYDIQKTISRGL